MGLKPRRPWTKGELGLADDWRVWLVDNLLAGVAGDRLIEILADHQVPRALAAREVTAIAASPVMVACERYRVRAQQLEMVHALAHHQAAQAPDPGEVERVSGLPAREFFTRYWAHNQPVVITDLTAGWPARDWTPESLAARFGDLVVEVCTGREADTDPDMNWDAHRTGMPLADFVDRVRSAEYSNDLYLIANNRAMQRPELAALLADARPDPDIFELDNLAGSTSLWIGPAGTITPLHHDTTNIAFNQIYGRKRFRLIPPCDIRLLEDARGFYAGSRVDDLDLSGLLVKDVTVAPGETLFIPAGWWHEVEALDVSISFSLMCFRRPNNLDWYRPAFADELAADGLRRR